MPSGYYKISRVQFKLTDQDPLMHGRGMRYHTFLFVETKSSGGGIVHHVSGDLVAGMSYIRETKELRAPESYVFRLHRKEDLGYIKTSDYAEVHRRLGGTKPPPRQVKYNLAAGQWERCKPDGSSYGPNDEIPTYWKCTEWVDQQGIPAIDDLIVRLRTQAQA
ncbi:hypothetical protein B7494_g4713 [Chlorociboria aeruginascens]|nr:hypothetical protein B7494_g4713 [Chlorociboria aeruginascens]